MIWIEWSLNSEYVNGYDDDKEEVYVDDKRGRWVVVCWDGEREDTCDVCRGVDVFDNAIAGVDHQNVRYDNNEDVV